MKLLNSFFSRLYVYSTVCIVIGSPLFFIPGTIFSPETTYYITVSVLIAVAIFSYVISALITKKWHAVSKFEFISYFVFCLAIILSSIFSRDAYSSLFGDSLSPVSGMALISLPIVMYLVRNLPDTLRRKLKYIFVFILSLASFVFILGLMLSGKAANIATQLFSGFSSATSFAVYIGIFAIALFFFIKKTVFPIKYKIVVLVTAALFITWLVSLSLQDGVRPNLSSTSTVGKGIISNHGPFGIGPGNFTRAWQLYRPSEVINSPYFGYDFNQGSSTLSTMFVTIGVVGLLSFMFLIVSSLYNTFVTYRKTKDELDRFILGFITFILFYFACLAWIAPLSYSVLIVWMIVSGFGVAKIELGEYHPSKKLSILMVPVAILLIMNAYLLIERAQAFALYGKALKASSNDESIDMITKASAIYPFDGFYRTQVEYAILANREIVANTTLSQEDLQKQYLTKTQIAIEAARAAIKINSDNYQNYVSLGRAYELAIPFDKESEYRNAKLAYQEALKLYPENPYIYIMLARLEASVGTKEGVREQLTEALKKKQNFADALYLMSQLEASDEKIEEALNYAIEAIRNAPNDPLTYTQAGLLFYGKKDYENAVNALKTGLEKDPNNVNIAYFLSLALRDGGRPDLAKPIVEELIKRNPNNSDLEILFKSLNTSTSTTSTTTPIKSKK